MNQPMTTPSQIIPVTAAANQTGHSSEKTPYFLIWIFTGVGTLCHAWSMFDSRYTFTTIAA